MPEQRSLSEAEIAVAKSAAALLEATNMAEIDLNAVVVTIREQYGVYLAAAAAALLLNTVAYVERRIASGDQELAVRFPIIVEEADLCE